ncbi:MAG: membrane protein insertion efficiency factor YidD [Chloroflexi bacterium]|nr:membrane protein insertion efficiency factor YidD [Chloroflexota bacterium]
MKFLALASLRFYKRRISPMLPPSCRFYPTCSEYMYEAIQVYGVFRGGWMGMKRIVRCNPMNPGGFDPVPPKKERAQT